MNKEELKLRISQGESSALQFKLKWSDNDKMAREMVAFANSRGGAIVFGIEDKTGRIEGLSYDEVQTLSSQAGNMAENNIVPTLYIHSYPEEIDGKTVLVVEIPAGSNKPYKTLKGGEIYVKQGADKRLVKENRELMRMFYDCGQYYPDSAGVPGTSIRNLSESLIDRFFENQFGKRKEDFNIPTEVLYENMSFLDEKGQATLAGLLFFGSMPTWKCPQFKIKAVCFVGNDLGGTQYRDSVDIEGTIPEMYNEAIRFCESNLHHLQEGQSFNSVGILEVPRVALEELIQNSLVHREMLGEDVVKLLVFDNRIEIHSPGCLPANLTIEKIKLGRAAIRNPLMAQLCAKTMPYRGLGSGITRAMKSGARIDLCNDIDSDRFIATIWRDKNYTETTQTSTPFTQKEGSTTQNSETTTQKEQSTTQKILELIRKNPTVKIQDIASAVSLTRDGVNYQIRQLKQQGKLRRVGGDNGGHWEIIEQ